MRSSNRSTSNLDGKVLLDYKLQKIIEELQGIFPKHDCIFVGFSGGKDSTILLHLTIQALIEMRDKNQKLPDTFVCHSNTLVENPVLHEHAIQFLNDLSAFIKEEGLPVRVTISTPDRDKTFWFLLIGKGYPLPHRYFRWCQRALKIKPTQKFIKGKLREYKNPLLLLGHRADESDFRKAMLNKKVKKGTKWLKYKGVKTYAPLLNLTKNDVWEFLLNYKSHWGYDYSIVFELYKEATGECPIVADGGGYTGCGSRFGCWTCTLVKEDRSLANMATHDDELRYYIEFRNWLIKVNEEEGSRYPFTRKGTRVERGFLTLTTRKKIMEKLLELEKKVGKKLISDEEVSLIKEFWEEDRTFISEMGKKFGITVDV